MSEGDGIGDGDDDEDDQDQEPEEQKPYEPRQLPHAETSYVRELKAEIERRRKNGTLFEPLPPKRVRQARPKQRTRRRHAWGNVELYRGPDPAQELPSQGDLVVGPSSFGGAGLGAHGIEHSSDCLANCCGGDDFPGIRDQGEGFSGMDILKFPDVDALDSRSEIDRVGIEEENMKPIEEKTPEVDSDRVETIASAEAPVAQVPSAKLEEKVAVKIKAKKATAKPKKPKAKASKPAKTSKKAAKKAKASKKPTTRKIVPRSERDPYPCCNNYPRAIITKIDKIAKKLGISRAKFLNRIAEKAVARA